MSRVDRSREAAMHASSAPSLGIDVYGRYLLQGNIRLLIVQSTEGRTEARSVLRLLLRADTMSPVIFMDPIYYCSEYKAALEKKVTPIALTP